MTWRQAIKASRSPYCAAVRAGFRDAIKAAEELFWYAVFMAGVFCLGIVIVEAFRGHR